MEKPTLEEVKKYFEKAEKIKDHAGDVGFVEFDKIRLSNDGRGFNQNSFSKNWLVLWHEEKGFAEIITTKEPTYSITADQLMQLENGFTLPKLQEWFPEVFVKKLEVGKWYKLIPEEDNSALVCITDLKTNECFGFTHYGDFFKKTTSQNFRFSSEPNTYIEATEQEVFEALKNEAVKRGFVEGVYFEDLHTKNLGCIDVVKYCKGSEDLRSDGWCVFYNGIWATLTPTKTRKQAEK